MEFPKVGQHCSHISCSQLDFLPLSCNKCGTTFCSEHYNLHVGTCENSCQVAGASHAFDSASHAFDSAYTCSLDGCNETSLVPLVCDKCQEHYCVKHRYHAKCYERDHQLISAEREKYAAPVRKFNEAKIAVDKQLEQNLLQVKKKGKNNSLVNKIQLMKIKNKAKGLKSIPVSDRIYFNVMYLQSEQANPIFVSKNWSIGRTVDAIATELNLQNDNNKSIGRRLQLFNKATGAPVTQNLSDIVQNIINEGVLIDGDSLVIDYVQTG